MVHVSHCIMQCKANIHLMWQNGLDGRENSQGPSLLYGVCLLHYASPYYKNIK